MDVGTIIAIAIAALVIVGLVVLVGRRRRQKVHDERRVEARTHREEARVRNARADRAAAEAEERAARAKREQAMAEEQAATAHRERRFASEREEHAAHIDPDTDGDADTRTGERQHEQHRR
jgi:F0F1-type ATP synthase membrane subunit b/b'